MQMPSLTVVVPVYNGENFLGETLRSVLLQSYPAAEILVIDDGSTDATATVAASFGDRVRLITVPNGGVSAARNHGISTAQTEWVALMDHDDLWEPTHLANLARRIARTPDADVCYTGARELRPGPDGIFRPAPELMPFPSEAELPTMLLERCAFIPSATALRRSAVLAAGGFDRSFVNLQDWECWLRLYFNGARFIHTPEPTLLYRVHPASRTHNALTTLRHSRNVIEQCVFPHLSLFRRVTRGRRTISRLEGEASILLRQNGSPGALALMLKSIARHPFHEPRRYRIAAHMLLRGYPLAKP
jgi:glycosyltransferase involved in cell wall biosynthesis